MLAVALDDVDDALARPGQAHQAVGDLLLLGVGQLLRLVLGLQHHRAVGLDVVAPGQSGLAIGIDDLPGEAPAGVAGVLLEEVLGHALARLIAPEEGHRVDVRLQIAQELDGLGGQAVAPVLGEVEPRVVAVGHGLHDGHDAEEEQDHDRAC